MPVGCYKQMSTIKEGVIMRLQLYLKTRYACATALTAPQNDLQLLREFESYEAVAKAATKSYSGHFVEFEWNTISTVLYIRRCSLAVYLNTPGNFCRTESKMCESCQWCSRTRNVHDSGIQWSPYKSIIGTKTVCIASRGGTPVWLSKS